MGRGQDMVLPSTDRHLPLLIKNGRGFVGSKNIRSSCRLNKVVHHRIRLHSLHIGMRTPKVRICDFFVTWSVFGHVIFQSFIMLTIVTYVNYIWYWCNIHFSSACLEMVSSHEGPVHLSISTPLDPPTFGVAMTTSRAYGRSRTAFMEKVGLSVSSNSYRNLEL